MSNTLLDFRAQLIANIITMMDNEVLYWEKEWVASQFNLLTKHIYTGGNTLKLSIIAYLRG